MAIENFRLEDELKLIHEEITKGFKDGADDMESLADNIVTVQKELVPVDTGQIKSGLNARTTFKPDEGVEIHWSSDNAPYDWFVEFGTGIKGKQNRPEVTPAWWQPIYRDTAWVYFDKRLNQFVTTTGQPARAFFFPPIVSRLLDFHKISIQEVDKACDRYVRSKL